MKRSPKVAVAANAMTLNEVIQMVVARTTDQEGHIATFVFHSPGYVGHVDARLDKSAGLSMNLWKIIWTVHWRSDRGQEQRDSSTDVRSLLSRFGHVELRQTSAEMLDDLV